MELMQQCMEKEATLLLKHLTAIITRTKTRTVPDSFSWLMS